MTEVHFIMSLVLSYHLLSLSRLELDEFFKIYETYKFL